MKRIAYLLISLLPVCINYIVICISSAVSFIINAYIDKYISDGDFALSSAEISAIISESFEKTNETGLAVGSIISIIIFASWLMKIRKNAKTRSRFKFSILTAAFVYACASQAILHLALGSSFSDFSTGKIMLLIITGAIGEQILCRAITMHYACMASENFLAANTFQAFIIACTQRSLLQGLFAFILGFLMGILFDRAGEGGLQHYSINA
mgnify:CR=1 FL=1